MQNEEPETDPELERVRKLYTYYTYFKIMERFEITFPSFVDKVDTGVWSARFQHFDSVRYFDWRKSA